MTSLKEAPAAYRLGESFPVSAPAHWYDAEEMRWAARHWAARIGVKLSSLHLREMRTKWASVSAGGRLTLNTDLLPLPRDLGDIIE